MADQRNITAPQDAPLAFRGCCHALRPLVLPLIALMVISGIAAAGVVESRAERPASCGLAITVQDPDLRASFVRFDRQQSAAARKVCAVYQDRR
jgi:hypothetical protein